MLKLIVAVNDQIMLIFTYGCNEPLCCFVRKSEYVLPENICVMNIRTKKVCAGLEIIVRISAVCRGGAERDKQYQKHKTIY